VAQRARPEPLSERERDIAALVAGGLSNKEVGAALYVSEKTVRNTLTRAYAKLGVRSRTELVRRLSAGGPEDQPRGPKRRVDLQAVPDTV
jgi:DNA-binding CsgD family transcriptional regulator